MVDAILKPPPESPAKQGVDRVAFISFDSKTAGRYLPTDRDQRRRDVRSQAAKSSALARKATLAKKAAAVAAAKSTNRRELLTPNSDCSIAHNAYQSQIWQDILSNRALYHATQLVVVTVRGNFAGEQGPLDPHRPSISWDRMYLAQIIRATLAAGNIRDVIPAIALLAGWEYRFGDSASFNTHVNAWKRLKDCQDSSYPQSVEQLPGVLDAIILAVSKAVRVLAAGHIEQTRHDSRKGASPAELAAARRKSSRTTVDGADGHPGIVASDPAPSGFDVFDLDQLDVLELRGFARTVTNFDFEEQNIISRLCEAVIPLMVWQPNDLAVPRTSIDRNALYCLRAMMIVCVGIFSPRSPDMLVDEVDITEGLRLHIDCITRLNVDEFVGTKYEDMLIWTLTLCLALSPHRDRRMQRLLCNVLYSRGINDCSVFEAILGRFCYPEDIIGPICRRLFETMIGGDAASSSTVALLPAPAAALRSPSKTVSMAAKALPPESSLSSPRRNVAA